MIDEENAMVEGITYLANLEIPSKIREHRFYRQLEKSLAERKVESGIKEPVLGTHDVNRSELYGWYGSVPMHVDNKGIVYFVLLNDVKGVLMAEGCEPIDYKKGSLIRMNDFVKHSVVQEGNAFALFVGVYDEPNDKQAIQTLRDGLQLLASDEDNYFEAPRYIGAKLEEDECMAYCATLPPALVPINRCENTYVMRIEDAKRIDALPLECSHDGCDRMATTLDHHFPFHWDYNCCDSHSLDCS